MLIKALFALALMAAPALATEVTLVLDGWAGNTPFRLGSVYPGMRAGSFYRPELLRYYISKITIHHDGSKRTHLPDLYLLVDVRELGRYSLGDLDVGSVDSMTFHIGVDPARNHLDPTTYPSFHPLALKVPSMHWGWAGGYRYVTYEGASGTSASNLAALFQIHTVDTTLYTRVAFKASSTRSDLGIEIPVRADYGRLFDDIDVSLGVVLHGNTDEAVTLMKNIGTRVFSAGSTTSVDSEDASPMVMWPNPAADIVLFDNGTTGARVTDLSGVTIMTTTCDPAAPLMSIASLSSGTYGVLIQRQDGSTAYETLVVTR
ncbi:MAG: hypothetical protein FGM33_08370 [Candidatus Kapabacteria bacterium]|nr:hypothetical protein [Candidatus Kapabacteria bacterium]